MRHLLRLMDGGVNAMPETSDGRSNGVFDAWRQGRRLHRAARLARFIAMFCVLTLREICGRLLHNLSSEAPYRNLRLKRGPIYLKIAKLLFRLAIPASTSAGLRLLSLWRIQTGALFAAAGWLILAGVDLVREAMLDAGASGVLVYG